jgi:hypothetical protein
MDTSQVIVGSVAALAPMGLMVLALFAYRWRSRSRGKRNPLTKALLTSPGTSLRASLKKNEDDLEMLLLGAVAIGAYLFGLIMAHRMSLASSSSVWIVIGAVTIISGPFLAYRTVVLFHQIQIQRLGLDGEMGTGEVLNRLMHKGYEVYHDIPGANFNVDHVVIGKNGVFAFETKAHAKPDNGYKASFDGRVIRYPDWSDSKAVEQAKLNAQTLGKYLTAATGQKIRVMPIVALPGWHVTRTGKTTGCLVLGSGEIENWVPKIEHDELTPAKVTMFAHQLDRLCRSEKPMVLSRSDASKYEHKIAI